MAICLQQAQHLASESNGPDHHMSCNGDMIASAPPLEQCFEFCYCRFNTHLIEQRSNKLCIWNLPGPIFAYGIATV